MKKPIIKVNNHLKGDWGTTDTPPGKRPLIQINLKKHKEDPFKKRYTYKQSVADTMVHELMHARHPRMTEKTVYKKTARKMRSVSKAEVEKLYNKIK